MKRFYMLVFLLCFIFFNFSYYVNADSSTTTGITKITIDGFLSYNYWDDYKVAVATYRGYTNLSRTEYIGANAKDYIGNFMYKNWENMSFYFIDNLDNKITAYPYGWSVNEKKGYIEMSFIPAKPFYANRTYKLVVTDTANLVTTSVTTGSKYTGKMYYYVTFNNSEVARHELGNYEVIYINNTFYIPYSKISILVPAGINNNTLYLENKTYEIVNCASVLSFNNNVAIEYNKEIYISENILKEAQVNIINKDNMLILDYLPFSQPIDNNEISYINDMYRDVVLNSNYSLPQEVLVHYKDGSVGYKSVTWDNSNVDTSRNGVFSYTGSVESYPNKVNLIITVKKHSEIYSTGRSNIKTSQYDNDSLKYNADFRTKVADGVHWVPIVSLGKPKYTINEMKAWDNDPVAAKQKITNLYEAILYARAKGFKSADSRNKVFFDGKYYWGVAPEFKASVINNGGECGDHAGFISYLLENDYDEVGQILYKSEINYGLGHVFNYIKYNGKYYTFDLTRYTSECNGRNVVEMGNLADYKAMSMYDVALRNLHEGETLGDLVAYIKECNEKSSPTVDTPVLFVSYRTDGKKDLPFGWVEYSNKYVVYFPNDSEVMKVFVDTEKAFLRLIEPEKPIPEWSDIKP